MVADLLARPLCATAGCVNHARRDRSLCHRCTMRRWRAENPINAQFHRLKAKAKKRRIPFTLTLEDFREFCQATGYAERVGCGDPADLQCDRIDARLGYSRDNIQALAFLDNARKGAAEKQGRTLCVHPITRHLDPALVPF